MAKKKKNGELFLPLEIPPQKLSQQSVTSTRNVFHTFPRSDCNFIGELPGGWRPQVLPDGLRRPQRRRPLRLPLLLRGQGLPRLHRRHGPGREALVLHKVSMKNNRSLL